MRSKKDIVPYILRFFSIWSIGFIYNKEIVETAFCILEMSYLR